MSISSAREMSVQHPFSAERRSHLLLKSDPWKPIVLSFFILGIIGKQCQNKVSFHSKSYFRVSAKWRWMYPLALPIPTEHDLIFAFARERTCDEPARKTHCGFCFLRHPRVTGSADRIYRFYRTT